MRDEEFVCNAQVWCALNRAHDLLSQMAISSGLVEGSPKRDKTGGGDSEGAELSPGIQAVRNGKGRVLVERYFGRGKEGCGGSVAVLVRDDGTGEARYPNGSVAVSVSGSRGGGFNITAMYRNGGVALTADAEGNAMVCMPSGAGGTLARPNIMQAFHA